MLFVINILNLFLCISAFNLTHHHQVHEAELDATYWESMAKTELFESQHRENIYRKAKNVIIFVGGGMGLSTITPARILKGQLHNNSGEEAKLNFEKFPNTCLLKTYAIDEQVPDSAATATALLSGVKTNSGVTGVTARVKKGVSNCEIVQNNIVTSIFDHAFEAGKSTGIVTNAGLTEAIAAGAYASTADRDWQGSIPPKFSYHPTHEDCKDIARQLVENHPGKNLNVILGGGGRYLFPKNYTDPISGKTGQREDGLNLVQTWNDYRKESGLSPDRYKFVTTRDNMVKEYDNNNLDYLFGVFNQVHLSYEKERDIHVEPTLEEMVGSAIKVLKKNEHGFLLVVEAGLIDLAHHENYANLALYETLALDNSVERALKLISIEDTLIVVTADHSQGLTINGYQPRGHNALGVSGYDDESHKAFTTLTYSTGPGYRKNRTDPNTVDTCEI